MLHRLLSKPMGPSACSATPHQELANNHDRNVHTAETLTCSESPQAPALKVHGHCSEDTGR